MNEGRTKVRNFLYTVSYVRKRLREEGFQVRNFPCRYQAGDGRYWSLIVEREGAQGPVLLTCLKEGVPRGEGSFSIMGPRCLNFRVITRSVKVLVENLLNVMEDKVEEAGGGEA